MLRHPLPGLRHIHTIIPFLPLLLLPCPPFTAANGHRHYVSSAANTRLCIFKPPWEPLCAPTICNVQRVERRKMGGGRWDGAEVGSSKTRSLQRGEAGDRSELLSFLPAGLFAGLVVWLSVCTPFSASPSRCCSSFFLSFVCSFSRLACLSVCF